MEFEHENGLGHTNWKILVYDWDWITLGLRIDPKVVFCISDRWGFRLKGLEEAEAGKGNASPKFDCAGRISIPFPCEPVFKKDFGIENVLKKGIGLRKKNVLKTMAC